MISSVRDLPSAGTPNSVVFFFWVDKSPFMLMKKKRENSPNLGKHCDKISQRIETADGRKPGIKSIVFRPAQCNENSFLDWRPCLAASYGIDPLSG